MFTLREITEIFPQIPNALTPMLVKYLEGETLQINGDLLHQYGQNLSEFTMRVLNEVAKVPFGRTITYGQLAAKIGAPGACRAVGSALGRNPLPVIIPCHRVVAANGTGGYAFGREIKKRLLEFETTL